MNDTLIDLFITLSFVAILCSVAALLYIIRPLRQLLDRIFPVIEEYEPEETRVIGFEIEEEEDELTDYAVITQLECLRKHCECFITADDDDSVWRADVAALDTAIAALKSKTEP